MVQHCKRKSTNKDWAPYGLKKLCFFCRTLQTKTAIYRQLLDAISGLRTRVGEHTGAKKVRMLISQMPPPCRSVTEDFFSAL
jgi:hypothetical protein